LLAELDKEQAELVRRLDPKAPGKAPERIELDEKRFRWMLNEDAMGTEKLSEGIRGFAKDLRTLRELVTHRLAKAA
jgi:transaldolase